MVYIGTRRFRPVAPLWFGRVTVLLNILWMSCIAPNASATQFGKVLLGKVVSVHESAFFCVATGTNEEFLVGGLDVLEAAEVDHRHVSLTLRAGVAPQVISNTHCLKIGFYYPGYVVEGNLDWSNLKYGENYSFRVYRVEDAENPYTFLNGSFCILKTPDGETEYINAGDAGSAHDRARCRAAWDERQRVANELKR